MKKFTFILFFTLSSSLFTLCQAQYTVLYDFDFGGPKGSNPHGDLTISHKILYGMGQLGGIHGDGAIFSVDTDGNGYRDLYDFNGPYGVIGSLMIHGQRMYGMTSQGGGGVGVYCPTGCGCVFSVDTNGTNFKELLKFNGNNGGYAWGNLTLFGGKLFGLSLSGGVNNAGCAFTIDTNGNNYKDILDFNQTNGAAPEGSFILLANKLYGMAAAGGVHSDGCIFSIDTNGNGYKDLHDFDGTNGSGPGGSLLYSAGKFYGMTVIGGAYDSGVVFSIDTNGSNYKKLYDLNRATGAYPRGTLSILGSTLYGLADLGGVSDSGVMFSIDTNGAGFTKIYDFAGIYGTNPFGSLTLSGNNFYGMTSYGGTIYHGGVVFTFNKNTTGTNHVQGESDNVQVYPNPSKGIFTISPSHAELAHPDESFGRVSASQPIIEIYNVMGQKITIATLKEVYGDNRIDITNQPNGVYFYRVLNNDGSLLNEGKIVIEK